MVSIHSRLCFEAPYAVGRIAVVGYWLREMHRMRLTILVDYRRLIEGGGVDMGPLQDLMQEVHCPDAVEHHSGDIVRPEGEALDRCKRKAAVRSAVFVMVLVHPGLVYRSGLDLVVAVDLLEEGSRTEVATVVHTVAGTLMLPGATHSLDAL